MAEMKVGECPKHGKYFTDVLIGCPKCWEEDAEDYGPETAGDN